MKIWEISKNPDSLNERFWSIITSNVHYSRSIPDSFLVSAGSEDRARAIARDRFNLSMKHYNGNVFTPTLDESALTESRKYFNCRLLREDQKIDQEKIIS